MFGLCINMPSGPTIVNPPVCAAQPVSRRSDHGLRRVAIEGSPGCSNDHTEAPAHEAIEAESQGVAARTAEDLAKAIFAPADRKRGVGRGSQTR